MSGTLTAQERAEAARMTTPAIDLRCGDYRTALADVGEVDAVICDPPYSARTHAAQRSAPRDPVAAAHGFAALEYEAWGASDVRAFVAAWSPRTRGWFCVFSDHALAREYEAALEDAGRYVFAPLPQVTINRSVRLAGDGPACWTCWLTVARPRSRAFASWKALPGAYVDDVGDRSAGEVRGAKQLSLMRAIVRDYTRPGDLVCDPCAGGATTLLAAAIEGRRAVGAELDSDTFAKAQKRIAKGYTPATLFDSTLSRAKQEPMFDNAKGGKR